MNRLGSMQAAVSKVEVAEVSDGIVDQVGIGIRTAHALTSDQKRPSTSELDD